MAEDLPRRMPYPFPLPEDLLEEYGEEGRGKDSISSFAIFNPLLRHARWVIGLPILAFVLTALYMGNSDQPFVAESRFLPADAEIGGGGGGVVSQLNRLVGGSSSGPDGMFYSYLIQSSAFLRSGADSEFEFERPTEDGGVETVRGTLAEIYDLDTGNEEADARASLSMLRSIVSAHREVGTNFVVLSVRSPWKGLAVAVNSRLLELVNDFNVEQRQTQAAAERQFVEARMAEVQVEQTQAESELVRFLENNQRYEQSPRLRYEALRLQSQVDLKRNLYSSLAQSYEQARISEVRNTPVVTVLERPEDTVYRPRGGNAPLRYGLMAFVVVALLTIGFVGARVFFERQREEHPDDFDEFRQLARDSLPERLRARVAALRGRGNGGGPPVAAKSTSGEPS